LCGCTSASSQDPCERTPKGNVRDREGRGDGAPSIAKGTHGSIEAKYRAHRKVRVAHTRFRDFAGVTRLVQCIGRSFERAANLRLAKRDTQVAESVRAVLHTAGRHAAQSPAWGLWSGPRLRAAGMLRPGSVWRQEQIIPADADRLGGTWAWLDDRADTELCAEDPRDRHGTLDIADVTPH
jgi:hypothetical protein